MFSKVLYSKPVLFLVSNGLYLADEKAKNDDKETNPLKDLVKFLNDNMVDPLISLALVCGFIGIIVTAMTSYFSADEHDRKKWKGYLLYIASVTIGLLLAKGFIEFLKSGLYTD